MSDTEDSDELVWVIRNGGNSCSRVYHTSLECQYIRRSETAIRQVSLEEAAAWGRELCSSPECDDTYRPESTADPDWRIRALLEHDAEDVRGEV